MKREKGRRPRKVSAERAAAINRKRDMVEGPASIETDQVRVLPGRQGTALRGPSNDWAHAKAGKTEP